ncbi:DUF3368 domain-containing protein [Spirosoma arcticum]
MDILLIAKQLGLLEVIKTQVEALITTTKFRIGSSLFNHVLTLAGES